MYNINRFFREVVSRKGFSDPSIRLHRRLLERRPQESTDRTTVPVVRAPGPRNQVTSSGP